MTRQAKICGITDPAAMDCAVDAGASMVGLVFFSKSPRNLSVDEAAMLAAHAPNHVAKVGLFVDPDDDALDRVLARVPLDVIQLHGHEAPQRCAEIRTRTGCKVMKALGIHDADDMDQADAFRDVCDFFLFDAKPPKDADRPGGNAVAFDWHILHNRRFDVPWLLAGGLNPDNVAAALRISGAPIADTSSGVEDAPGRKDLTKIRAFLDAVRRTPQT